ncbi:VanZ family protein [Companilactobacillus ginsenosidimutans]|uniref:Antibiotic resistance protein VanZ n=1 Tax=Companilactobacillus ginsenosidimutans TaxID=1007676 RepID=A0A0H4QXF6_9LACO|nr:VanZ family protein [Companilactobacillus ginsenosidimutans]AKP66170.1 antibiotic resistance protein VanZ [Companilactobacillus ginsenosidimutans]
MIFLGPLYNYISNLYSARINHFPLIRLSFFGVDKAILYTLIFIFLRILWVKIRRKKISWNHEFWLAVFAFYVFLLFFLTVFRDGYFLWDFKFFWHRPLSEINFVPLVETFKLLRGQSRLDFFYNLFGNIVWFIPMGIFKPSLGKKNRGFGRVVLIGALVSVSIEALQFVLSTGVTDIDDVISNTIGTAIGFLLYFICNIVKKRIKELKL